MKKLMALVCTLVCALYLLSAVLAEGGVSGDYEYVLLPDGTAEISAYNGTATKLSIPKTLDGLAVTSIGDCAFFFNGDLQSVELPDGITAIKWMAFSGCSNLTELVLPETVSDIDPAAFSNCDKLTFSVLEGSAAETYCKSNNLPYKTASTCFVSFGHYEQDGNFSNGKEDIEWLVLEVKGNKALLISRNTLDCQYYNLSPCNWEESYLRAWLNSFFLSEAFNSQEQAAIQTMLIDNSAAQDMEGLPFVDMGEKFSAAASGKHTTDKIFLLSYREANAYFLSDEERLCEPSMYVNSLRDFDEAALRDTYGLTVSGGWWLRGNGLSIETSDGKTYWAEYKVTPAGNAAATLADDSAVGVRPVLWVDLSAISGGTTVSAYTPAPTVEPTATPAPTPTPTPTPTPAPTVAAKNVTWAYDPYDWNLIYPDSTYFRRGGVRIKWDDIGVKWLFAVRDVADNGDFIVRDRDVTANDRYSELHWCGVTEGHTYEFFLYPVGTSYDGPTSYRLTCTIPVITTTWTGSAKGLLSDVTVFAILNADDTIGKIIVDCRGETEVIAKPCTEGAFLSQFIGKKGPFYNIDVVTGATHTSNAVADALNQYYESVLPTEEPGTAESIGYYWADYQITLENWNLAPAILNQPLMNCTGFTYTLYLGDIQSGSPYGEWTLYGQTRGDAWVRLDSFTASSDTTRVEISLAAPMDIYALCAVRKLHTDCAHTYAYEISNPKYGDNTADGYYHYQLFRYYCTEHQQSRLSVNGNMIVTMRRSIGDEANDPGIQTLRNFVTAGAEWLHREWAYSSYHEAVNALLPSLNSGACNWIREWHYILSSTPLPEEVSNSEQAEFGSLFTYGELQWQGKCIKTPYQATPTTYLNQATGDSRYAAALEEDFEVSINGDECTITRYTGTSKAVIIPATIGGRHVTCIGENAFNNCRTLETVVIPPSVAHIGANAFFQCSALKHVTIGSGVAVIDSGAFLKCESLTEIHLPENVQTVGGDAFAFCTSLTSVFISEGVTNIGNGAFRGNPNLEKVTIASSVQNISWSMFENCTALQYVTIPEGVASIDKYAFVGCSALEMVEIPESVTTIGDNAFMGCNTVTLRVVVYSNAHNWAQANGFSCMLELPTLP